ncbi:DUF3152 domain-containing protein [Streptomyces sp. NPDC001273]
MGHRGGRGAARERGTRHGRGRRRGAARRRRRRTVPAGLAAAAVVVALGAAVAHCEDRDPPAGDDVPVAAGDMLEGNTGHSGPQRGSRAADTPESSPPVSPSSPSANPPASASASVTETDIPATGPGTFTTARADGSAVGTGSRVRRYKVLVEDGIDIPASEAAAEVSAVLADRRGWTRDGVNSFRLVGSGSYDFVVKIATPGTTDRICGAAGLLTRGEVNCSVGTDVVVNLKRWVLGSPQFDGPIGEYRALIVNHEVGHRIGRGHEGCPGPGRPAPAMMQQIKGLDGCVANAWPYGRDGTYLGGPAVP